MKNMYEILDRMNLLEGKGSKPDFLDLDNDKNRKETMKAAAADADNTMITLPVDRMLQDEAAAEHTVAVQV